MKKLTAFFICLATLFAFTTISFAETEPVLHEGQFITSGKGNIILADNLELLSDIEEDYVKDNIAEAVAEKAISVGVVSSETTEQETADYYFSVIEDEDFAVMLFNKDEYALYFYGNAETEYAEDDDAFWMTESYFDGGAYFAAALQFPLDVRYHTVTEYDYTEEPAETTVSSEFPENYFTEIANNGFHTASLENGRTALLHDIDDSLTTNEEAQVLTDLMNAVRDTDFSIGIVITDDIGTDKSDYGVMDFTDVYYEDYCGKDTDGVLLLINNDTKYDWFSTSGRCIDMFYGKEDDVLDSTYDYLVDGNYGLACQAFVQSVKYYDIKANYDDDNYDDDDDFNYSYDEDGHHLHIEADDLEGGFALFFFAFFVAVIAVSIFAGSINSSYKMKKNVSAANYKLANSLVFTQSTDTFLRTYTTRRRVSSSSSSGSRSRSRSSGSRSHRSSGGGRHGGGGRRR